MSGLDGPLDVAICPNGRWMFVASNEGTLTVSERIAATAELIFRGVQRDAAGVPDGLRGVRAIALAPTSERIFTTAYYDDTLSAFAVDTAPLPTSTPAATPTPTPSPTPWPTIACRQTIDGALQPGDPQIFGGDVWTDRYDFSVAESTSVRFTLAAEGFTPYLWIAASASGSALFAGGSPQESTVGAGSYRVIASSWPTVLPANTCPYQLGMTCATPATPTPTAKPTPACLGDCNGDGVVTVQELLTMVNIALGKVPLAAWEAGDGGNDGQITIDEILVAVRKAVHGCS